MGIQDRQGKVSRAFWFLFDVVFPFIGFFMLVAFLIELTTTQ